MNKSIFYILLLTALPLCFTGCRKEVRPTSMTIKDSVRHYYPIKQGQQLRFFSVHHLPDNAVFSVEILIEFFIITCIICVGDYVNIKF